MLLVNVYFIISVCLVLKVHSDATTGTEIDVCHGSFPPIEILPIGEHLPGKWISNGCESRIGARFVLRSYEFRPNFTFSLYLHHYSDEWCSSPLYSVSAQGSINAESYLLSGVKIVPHSTAVARELQEKVNHACPGFAHRKWKANREYSLLADKKSNSNSNGHAHKRKRTQYIDCTHSLNIDFNELLLIKIQKIDTDIELVLGDASLSKTKLQPIGYQLPLMKTHESLNSGLESTESEVKITNTEDKTQPASIVLGHFDSKELTRHLGSKKLKRDNLTPSHYRKLYTNCAICDIITKATITSPPYLSRWPQLPMMLTGMWKSKRCESQPLGGHLLRDYQFDEDTRSFVGKFRFYSDEFCEENVYTVVLTGEYFLGLKNNVLVESTEVDFFIHKIIITIHNSDILEKLNKPMQSEFGSLTKLHSLAKIYNNQIQTCNLGEYMLNIPKEIIHNDCKKLLRDLKMFEKNILKLQVNLFGTTLLSMGAREINFGDLLNSLNEFSYNFNNENAENITDRPSSYGYPMAHCGENTQQFESDFFVTGDSSSVLPGYLLIIVYLNCLPKFFQCN